MPGIVMERSLEEEYKKTGIKPADIAALRKWLKTQPHLPEKYITDLDIILTYHCCNHSSEVSKQVLDLNYTLRTLFTNFFLNRIVDDNIIKTLNVVLCLPLNIPSVDNSRAVYHRLIDLDSKNFVYSDAVRTTLMILDLFQYEEGTWPGFIILVDLAGVSLGHIAKLDLLSVQQVLYYLQEAMLVKLKGLHFLNAPSFVDRLLMIIKPFMKKELLQMLCIHSVGSSSLDKVIPIKALPKEAGGEYKTIEEAKNDMIDKFLANKEFFLNENRKRVVESSRPGKPKTLTDIFGGIEGSFKSLKSTESQLCFTEIPFENMKQISLQEEYSKDTGVTPQDVAALRQWLLTQPHLPEKYITDLDLILAYYCCCKSTGFTKDVLDLNYTLRSLLNAFKDRKIDRHILTVASNILITPLAKRTKEGYKIFFAHLINTDVKSFNFGDCVKLGLMMIDICQYEEGTWPGMLLVIDFDGITLGHLTKIDLMNLQQFLYYLQEALLVKLQGLHYINAPSFIDKLLIMMRPFLKKELMSMLHIHTPGSEKLQQYIPAEAFPKDCGGNSLTVDEYKDQVIAKLNASKEYFELDKHKKVTESLRPGKPKTITDIFGGVEGSFKKLEID